MQKLRPRYFNCWKFGNNCIQCDQPRKPKVEFEPSNIATITSETFMTKHVIISTLYPISLIDTGSEITLLREGVYRNLPEVSNLKHSASTN